MKITPIHHRPMKPEYNSPFSAAYAVEDAKLIFFSGCCTVPTYHTHPHDVEEERQWLERDIRDQTERTFAHIKEILDSVGADFSNILKLTIYLTDAADQDIVNEISARHFDHVNPPARTVVQVVALAHRDMRIEIDGMIAVAKD